MELGGLLDQGAITLKVHASSKRQALTIVAELAARHVEATAADIAAKLTARERLGSTGVGHGVAVPHARLKGLERMHGVFVQLDVPVDFAAVDEQPVDLIFALLAPADHPAEHLRALAKVSRALRQADLREHLRQARSPDAVRALLVREAGSKAA